VSKGAEATGVFGGKDFPWQAPWARRRLLNSRVFPGLWLDVPALLRSDRRALRAAIERGTADPAHGPFVARLRAR
jgi:hypothetical protein